MFLPLFLFFGNSITYYESQKYVLEYNLWISDSMFLQINSEPAIRIIPMSDFPSNLTIDYCTFHSCTGSDAGGTIFCAAACYPKLLFNCINQMEAVSGSAMYFEVFDFGITPHLFRFNSASQCKSLISPLHIKFNTTSFMRADFHDTNISSCTSNENGVLYFMNYCINVQYCSFADNNGDDGLLFNSDDISFLSDIRFINSSNFKNNTVRGVGTIYHDSICMASLNSLYFIENDELYTVQCDYSDLYFSNIFCDKWNPGGNITYKDVISNSFTLPKHTFLNTGFCEAEIPSTPKNPPGASILGTPHTTASVTIVNELKPKYTNSNEHKNQPKNYYMWNPFRN